MQPEKTSKKVQGTELTKEQMNKQINIATKEKDIIALQEIIFIQKNLITFLEQSNQDKRKDIKFYIDTFGVKPKNFSPGQKVIQLNTREKI